jgi:hypothetical protein
VPPADRRDRRSDEDPMWGVVAFIVLTAALAVLFAVSIAPYA